MNDTEKVLIYRCKDCLRGYTRDALKQQDKPFNLFICPYCDSIYFSMSYGIRYKKEDKNENKIN